ncbi:MAG: hypothetical protein EXR66_07365 [Dehalococcoidia bacterium]|nr:hypothetical protein [Dehalococcoidia bacterium]
MADRKVFDYSRGKYGVVEGLRDGMPSFSLPDSSNLESRTAIALGAFASGLVAAYLVGMFLLR